MGKKSKIIRNMMHDEIVRYSKYSFELEEKREQSLISQAGQMIAAFSFLTILLVTLVGALLCFLQYIKNDMLQRYIIITSSCVLFLFLLSLVLALTAQWRFKYESLNNPKDFHQYVIDNYKQYQKKEGFQIQWIDSFQIMKASRQDNNDKRVKLIVGSMITFYIGLLSFVVFLIIGLLMK